MDDSYLKEWNAKVESVSKDKFIILDRTAFFLVVEESSMTLEKLVLKMEKNSMLFIQENSLEKLVMRLTKKD